jgi:hypothetical protein
MAPQASGNEAQHSKGRKPPKDSNAGLFSSLSKPGVLQDAVAAKVVWARVKGYPWWPVSVLARAHQVNNSAEKSGTDRQQFRGV